MTKEKQEWLDKISIKAKELRGYNVNSSDSKAQQDMMSLITELKSAWAREAELLETLKDISKTDSANPDLGGPNLEWHSDWRNNTKKKSKEALAQHKSSLEK